MTSLKFCAIALLGLAATTLIKQWRSDYLPLLRLALVLCFGLAAVKLAEPIVSYLGEVTRASAIAPYATLLFKALSIAWLTQYAAEICRESGESAAASGVELIGKLELLLLAVPLLGEILGMADRLLSIGGGT